jgi:hypothetical protein
MVQLVHGDSYGYTALYSTVLIFTNVYTLCYMQVDGLEPMLYPLARRDLQHQGPRWVVQVTSST